MGRPSYVCATCSEHFTRKYSAKRHNHNIHNGAAEIVRLIDYLAGRSSGQYMPDNPFWYKRNNPYNNNGSATIADSISNAFEPGYLPQQAPLGISQYYESPIYPPMQIKNNQSYGTELSQDTVSKIGELKMLVYKYPRYCPDGLLQWIIISCVNGDNQLLDDKLEQLRTIDRRLNGRASSFTEF
jgi:hypothetical protein